MCLHSRDTDRALVQVRWCDVIERSPSSSARAIQAAARVAGMGPLRTALMIKLPCAAPQFFTGAKLANAYSFIGVIAAKFIMSTSGLGYSIAYAFNNLDNRTMYALMLFIIVLVTCINAGFHIWERRIVRRRRG